MNLIEAAIFILFFAIISVPIANRFRLPLEVFLVIGSCLISLIPGLPGIEINPQLIFNVFLPIILFYAAYFTSWNDFKINLRPIGLLAIGLVLVTMVLIALVAKFIFPDFSWAESFLLGAIISPTDASAATTLIRKLGAPRRIITILEGESLVNDASALILFRFALTAVIAGSFSFASAATQFVGITLGGIGIGLAVGYASVFVIKKIHSVAAETTMTFITALSAYLLGELFSVSGVIATVVCGIYFGIRFPALTTSRTRIHAKASWDTIIFIINGFVFTLLGLELPAIVENLQSHLLVDAIIYGVIVSVAVILTRIIWVFSSAYLTRKLIPAIARKDPLPSWQVLFIIGWCGMRGIVSLAAALSLPLLVTLGVAFPHRALILFITYCVIVVTLIVPTFTLPLLLKVFKLKDSEDKLRQEALARTHALEGIMGELQGIIKAEHIPETVINEFRNQVERRLKVIATQLNDTPYSTLNNEYQAIKLLTLAAIQSERKTLFTMRKAGEISDEVFHLLMDELDMEELRAKTLRV